VYDPAGDLVIAPASLEVDAALANLDTEADRVRTEAGANTTNVGTVSNALDAHEALVNNPHTVTASQTGAPTVSEMNSAISLALQALYPVGSVFLGANPTAVIGGTWSQVPEGTFIMSTVGSADGSGGSNSLTISEGQLPAHTHDMAHNHGSPNSGIQSNGHEHAATGLTFAGSALASHNHTASFVGTAMPPHSHDIPSTAVAEQAGPYVPSTVAGTDQPPITGETSAGTPEGTVTNTGVGAGTPAGTIGGVTAGGNADHTHTVGIPNYAGATGSVGSGTPAENRPKYIGREMWERTA